MVTRLVPVVTVTAALLLAATAQAQDNVQAVADNVVKAAKAK